MRLFLLKALTTSTLIILPLAASAQAQEQDATAQKLQTMFSEMLDKQKNLLNDKSVHLNYTGDLNVEKADGYYAVTLPHLAIVYPTGEKFEVGMVAVNAAPHENAGNWKMSVALPTPMTFYNAKGEQTSLVNIGSQRSAGVWNEQLDYFSKLDSNFGDINVSSKTDNFNLNIPATRVIYDLSQQEQSQLWSGPVSFSMQGLSIDDDGIQDVIQLGEIKLAMEMFDYDPQGMIEYRDLIASKLQGENAESAPLTPEEVSQLAQSFIKALGDGFVSNYEISDFAMKGKDANQFESLNIDKMQFGIDATGLKENKLDIKFRVGYQGFDMQPVPADLPKLAPSHLNLDISVDDLPLQELQALGAQTAENATTNPVVPQMQAMTAMMQLPTILSTAGSKIVLKNNSVGNDIYNITIDGTARPNPQSQFMAEADFTIAVRGFDAITQAITERIQQGDTQAANMQGVMAGLMMLKGFAEARATTDGAIEHVLKLNVTPEGQIKLNGQDISALMGMAGQQPKTPAPQALPETAPAAPAQPAD